MNYAGFKKWSILLIGLAAVLLITRQAGVFSPPAQKAANTPATVSVTTVEVGYVNKMSKLFLTGTLEGETSVIISPKIAGRIESVDVQDGQRVAAGQQLVSLESVELHNAVRINSEAVARAAAHFEYSKADYNRYQTLFLQNAISRQQLDSAETRLKVAETDLSSAHAALGNARQQLAYSSVLAPLAGFVANKSVTIGQVVAAGQQLMALESTDQVYAVVNIEQKDMGIVKAGMPAEIRVDTYPGQIFIGVVHIINPAAAAANRMFRTKLLIDNRDGRLKPGMFVKAGITTDADTKVLAIPRTAVFQKQGLSYVFIMEDNKAKRHQVEVGEVLGDSIEIQSGLHDKAIVITSNAASLKDGDTVTLSK